MRQPRGLEGQRCSCHGMERVPVQSRNHPGEFSTRPWVLVVVFVCRGGAIQHAGRKWEGRKEGMEEGREDLMCALLAMFENGALKLPATLTFGT